MERGPRIDRLVPYAHVADVRRSLAFYGLLGLAPASEHRDGAGRLVWAMAEGAAREGGERAAIMLALASGPIDAAAQAVLFYTYCDDVAGLRARLLGAGVADGAAFEGKPGPNGGLGVVFAVSRPFYMPEGELRLHDPDGYVVLVGQRG